MRSKPKDNGNRHYHGEIFSLNFQNHMLNSGIKCFVPLTDYKKLERKYFKLFKKYNVLKKGD